MNNLVLLLLQLLLRTSPCDIPDIQVDCLQYRIDTTPVQVCTAYHDGITWEAVIDEDTLLELWEDDIPSFEKHLAASYWKNIYTGRITGIEKPEYCDIRILNPNRHE